MESAVDRSRRPGPIMWLGLVLRLVLAGVLGWASIVKLLDHEQSRLAIAAYRVIPGDMSQWVNVIAWVLPALELTLAIMLVLGLSTRWAGLATAALMVLFVAGISSVWARGFSIDCGCFGGGGAADPADDVARYSSEIARDVVFAGMGLWLAIRPRSAWSLDGFSGGSTHEEVDPGDD